MKNTILLSLEWCFAYPSKAWAQRQKKSLDNFAETLKKMLYALLLVTL